MTVAAYKICPDHATLPNNNLKRISKSEWCFWDVLTIGLPFQASPLTASIKLGPLPTLATYCVRQPAKPETLCLRMFFGSTSFLGGPEIELHEGKYTRYHAGFPRTRNANKWLHYRLQALDHGEIEFHEVGFKVRERTGEIYNLHLIPHRLHGRYFFMHVRC